MDVSKTLMCTKELQKSVHPHLGPGNSSFTVFFDLGSVGRIQPFHRSLGADVLSDTAGVQLDAVINSLHTCITDAVVTAVLMSNCTLKHVAHYDKRFGLNPNCQHL